VGRDQLIFSRSFSTPLTSVPEFRQVLSVYAQQASARLTYDRDRELAEYFA